MASGRGHGPLPQPLGRYHAAAGAKAVGEARSRPPIRPPPIGKAYIAAIAEVFSDEAIKASQREDDQPDVEGYSNRLAGLSNTRRRWLRCTAWPDDDEATVFYALA
jgi:hypothetical protein